MIFFVSGPFSQPLNLTACSSIVLSVSITFSFVATLPLIPNSLRAHFLIQSWQQQVKLRENSFLRANCQKPASKPKPTWVLRWKRGIPSHCLREERLSKKGRACWQWGRSFPELRRLWALSWWLRELRICKSDRFPEIPSKHVIWRGS